MRYSGISLETDLSEGMMGPSSDNSDEVENPARRSDSVVSCRRSDQTVRSDSVVSFRSGARRSGVCNRQVPVKLDMIQQEASRTSMGPGPSGGGDPALGGRSDSKSKLLIRKMSKKLRVGAGDSAGDTKALKKGFTRKGLRDKIAARAKERGEVCNVEERCVIDE